MRQNFLTLNNDVRVCSVELGAADGFARDVGPIQVLRVTVHVDAHSRLTCTRIRSQIGRR